MIKFSIVGNNLILNYDSKPDNGWLYERLDDGDAVDIKRTFSVRADDLYGQCATVNRDEGDPVSFKIGEMEGDYICIDRDILLISFGLYIHKDMRLSIGDFVASKNVSIFRLMDELGLSEIWIGGDLPDSMPESAFRKMIKLFPNTYELRKYVLARISTGIREYFETKRDGEADYHKYINKKLAGRSSKLAGMFNKFEIHKYTVLLETLTEMLASEASYSEAQWQLEILEILLLLYPKYIRVFSKVQLKDVYNNKNRELDYMLVDSAGNIDIVEIKQPFDKCIVTNGRYRDNFIPLRELSGTVMQIEKYIFYLNKWGQKGERILSEKYANELPSNFEIRVTNPSGIIIMGRDLNLSIAQRQDFELIRRKYKNVIDIVTYDDLLSRLQFTIEQLKNNNENSNKIAGVVSS